MKAVHFTKIHKPEVSKQFNKLLNQRIIRDSVSSGSIPIWIYPKSLMVVDYRKLNKRTIVDKYPLPNNTDILDKLGCSTYFTTIDFGHRNELLFLVIMDSMS